MSKVRQCTARNVRGRRCGKRVRVDDRVPHDKVLCLVHRRGLPGRRCTAVNAHGRRCGQRVRNAAGVPHDKVLCPVHRHGWPGRPCTGVNVRGDPCARRVQAPDEIPDDQVLCAYHRRENKHLPPQRIKCSATRNDGEPCRAWALQDLVDSPRPLCTYHAGLSIGRSLPPDDQRCTALKPDGERCKKWILSDRPPAADREDAARLCSMHAGLTGFQEDNRLAWKHGYYARPTPQEVAAQDIFIWGRQQYSVHGAIKPGSDDWWELVSHCRLAIHSLLQNWQKGVVKEGPGVMDRHAKRITEGLNLLAKLVPRGKGYVRKNGKWVSQKPQALRTEADFEEWLSTLPDEFWEEVEKMQQEKENTQSV